MEKFKKKRFALEFDGLVRLVEFTAEPVLNVFSDLFRVCMFMSKHERFQWNVNLENGPMITKRPQTIDKIRFAVELIFDTNNRGKNKKSGQSALG